jgi:hypothetical protein
MRSAAFFLEAPMRLFTALCLLLCPAAVLADGLDRDGLLTEAPATPRAGTVRVSASSLGQSSADTSPGANSLSNGSSFSGGILWAPTERLAGDVGVYWQPGPNVSGPSVRVRYQLLDQQRWGLDLAAGARYKFAPFVHPNTPGVGELEFLVAAGKRFGNFELVLNGIFGVESGGGGGKDVEVKAWAGYALNERLRLGVDSRLQAEVGDDEGGAVKVGRDFDFTAGPAISWLLTQRLQLQALVGVIMPKGYDATLPVGMLAASFDF